MIFESTGPRIQMLRVLRRQRVQGKLHISSQNNGVDAFEIVFAEQAGGALSQSSFREGL